MNYKKFKYAEAYLNEDKGYRNDFTNGRLHHEIYMSDARKVAPENGRP